MTISTASSLICPPRFGTPRTDRPTLGPKAAAVGAKLLGGRPMMDWQRHVLDVALELDADGHPAYRRVVLTVPRQSGKTTLQLALFVHRALAWGSPQSMAYAAQTGSDARKKLVDQPNGQIPMLQRSPFRGLFRPRLTNGHEAILWKNGSQHGLAANTAKSGHGGTLDLALIDEAFAQVDARLEQAFSPAMVTIPDAQLWVVSTAGTDASTYLRHKVDAGRLSYADTGSGTAYFEWSADDDAPIDDPETWRRCMPALGITVSERVIAAELASMRAEGNEDEFRRAYLNQWRSARSGSDDVLANWGACSDPAATFADPITLAVVLAHDDHGPAASITACGRDAQGYPVIEVVDYESGPTGWVLPRLAELRKRHKVSAVGVVASSPAAALKGLPDDVTIVPGSEFATACQSFAQDVAAGMVRHKEQRAMRLAINGAARRFSGDGWRWSLRESRIDISPLVGAVVAAHLAGGESTYDPLDSIY